MNINNILIFQTNEQAKRGDTLKSKTSDLENNIFSARIELDNLRKYIEGISVK